MEPVTPSFSLPQLPFDGDEVVDVPPFGLCRRSDIWDAWLFAQSEAAACLRAWTTADRAERRDRHTVYTAALDREEQAAVVLAAVLRAASPARR